MRKLNRLFVTMLCLASTTGVLAAERRTSGLRATPTQEKPAAAGAAEKKKAENTGEWVSLFDGKTLKGWTRRGGTAAYSVGEGAIVGTTVKGSPNTFLCRGDYGDFVLEFDVLCDPPLNSGVQIRSHLYEKDTPMEGKPDRIRKKGEVYGYQCEIMRSDGNAGNFWDEARRARWLGNMPKKSAATKAFKDNAWNTYRIVAQGDRIRSWVNGVPCVDFRDERDARGFIGLQVHSIGKSQGPYRVRWKNIRIRELAPGEKVE